MSLETFLDPETWAMEQWGNVELGDSRRNERAVKVGAALAAHPGSSLPTQLGNWNDLRAAYRLFGEADVSHRELSQPHWHRTREQAQQHESPIVLWVQDSTELDYSHHTSTRGLGVIGSGKTQGLMMHSCLAVIPTPGNPDLLGLGGQAVWSRPVKTESETTKTRKRSEGEKWIEMLTRIGPVPATRLQRWVSVGDRESDIFSYLRRSQEQGWDSLVRVAQNRVVISAEGERTYLKTLARTLPPQAQKTIVLRGRDGHPQRSIELHIAWTRVLVCPPQSGPERHQAPQSLWCIRCWEDSPEGLEWILLTTVDPNLYSALVQVDWYASRWLIEEYHKCLKTGCALEARQLETAAGLMRLTGFLGIIAVRLLQLRTLSRSHADLPVQPLIPEEVLQLLQVRLGLFALPATWGQFWQSVARLGGFLARKSDGQPGWQSIWRGWLRLQDFWWGTNFQLHRT
ncbi:MAG: IS4 family transposase [Leptolyngbyaceae bacterium]|nr:IS4 family transposase [Leptolyngbyaceae bacterium]